MWELLESIFNELGLPYFRQGSLSQDGDYPYPSFYTFWNVSEAGAVVTHVTHPAYILSWMPSY